MKRSNRLLILLGLLIAISGSLAAMAYVAGSGGGGGNEAAAGPSATPEATVPVVYATKDIAAGTMITADMVSTKPMKISEHALLGVVTYDSTSQVVGSISSMQIKSGAVLASGALLNPGSAVDGKSLSGAIDKGMVAISMEVDQTNGVGTLIVPGDHVDIAPSDDAGDPTVSCTAPGSRTTSTTRHSSARSTWRRCPVGE